MWKTNILQEIYCWANWKIVKLLKSLKAC